MKTVTSINTQMRLTIKEAAALYNIPEWKLWDAVRKGILPCQRLLNRRIYLRIADIEAAFTQSVGGKDAK